MDSTKLSTILARMDRYQDVSTIEEKYKVRDIDEAIRSLKREISPPWTVKQTTIAIFKDVYVYSMASDHNVLAMIEKKLNDGSASGFRPNLKARYTSLEQFYQDEDSRNKIVEIWDGGDKFLGIRYKDINATSSLAGGNITSNFIAGGDASSPTAETVETIDGLNTIKFTVTSSSGTATITETISPSISNTDYKKKYYFRWVYLASVPTSITLRFGNDSSNYLSKTVTSQFSGQPLKANTWNLVAFNLNEASLTGSITSTAFDYAQAILTGATTGTYYLGSAYLRGYKKLDYYYYSDYNIKSSSSSVLDKKFFFDDTLNSYSLDDALVGQDEWIDVITFDAILTALSDNKNKDVVQNIAGKRSKAWDNLISQYPEMSPVIITQKQNFGHNPSNDWLNDTIL